MVFLSGYEDIMQINDQLVSFSTEVITKPAIYLLHSQLNQDQQSVFEPVSDGFRKVVCFYIKFLYFLVSQYVMRKNIIIRYHNLFLML